MFRKSSSSTSHLLSNGSCNLQDHEAQLVTEGIDAPPLPSLVYYAAVAKGAAAVSEYTAEGNADLPAIAAACLENVPPLHVSFSYTTNQRRFICLLDGAITYCAIMDEALTKADAYSFLQKVRDAFKAFGKGRGRSLTLGAHFLDDEMILVMRNLAASFVGVPQREKNRIEAELSAQHSAEVDLEISSPSAVAPLYDMSDHEFDSKTAEKRLGSRSPRVPLIGKGRKGKKKTKEQAKDGVEDKGQKAMDKDSSVEVIVDRGMGGGSEKNKFIEMHKAWRRKVIVVVTLDVLVCLMLLAVWLGVCQGVSCLKT
ncbi:hypothetical protein GOP47_0030459 [Adiantum capillus-veneris]|nr:hypothetical protein GOP47_0030459 [Adiantum capillus-veneris]